MLPERRSPKKFEAKKFLEERYSTKEKAIKMICMSEKVQQPQRFRKCKLYYMLRIVVLAFLSKNEFDVIKKANHFYKAFFFQREENFDRVRRDFSKFVLIEYSLIKLFCAGIRATAETLENWWHSDPKLSSTLHPIISTSTINHDALWLIVINEHKERKVVSHRLLTSSSSWRLFGEDVPRMCCHWDRSDWQSLPTAGGSIWIPSMQREHLSLKAINTI